ncbi:MAG TPA: hypothetical protein ENK25_03140 [Bacteroidetes bacterium]|nr:hypothetical protein [Bacteroidota bacterium]
MKKGIFIFFFLVICSVFSDGQVNKFGIPFVKNITPMETLGGEQNWSVVQDDRGIIYVANNDIGILEYDGITWRRISVPNNISLRDLCIDDRGTVYAGGNKEFGFLEPDTKGQLHYHSLIRKLDSSDMKFKSIYHIYFWKGSIYYTSTNMIFRYSPEQDSIRVFRLADDGFTMGNYGFVCNGRYFHVDALAGLLEFDGEHFKKVENGEFFSYNNISAILSILPYSSKELLIATYKFGVYCYNLETGTIRSNIFSPAANNYLKKNRFYDARMLPDSSYAMATLDGGLIIVSHKGIIIQILNRNEGLDNETVTKVYLNDKQPQVSQLWLAMSIGLANVELFSPFRYFSEDHGFKGSVNDLMIIGDKLYLATSAGVFLRTREQNGLAHFTRIPGINAQAWSFLHFTTPGNSSPILWVGTEEGIYELSADNKASLVEKRIHNLTPKGKKFYVFKLFASKKNPGKVFVGTGQSLAELSYKYHYWHIDTVYNLQDEVRTITEDKEGDLWFSMAYQGIGRLQKDHGNGYNLVIYNQKKGLPAGSENKVNFINHKILICTSKGLYRYQKEADTLLPDHFLGDVYANGSRAVRNIHRLNDSLYFLNVAYPGGKFYVEEVIRNQGKIHSVTTPFYRLPSQSAYAFAHEGNILWIAISNRIYSYNLFYKKNYDIPFHTLIRKITVGADSSLFEGTFYREDEHGLRHFIPSQPPGQQPEIKYRFNNVTFYWACPFFENQEKITYSFRLRNFDKQWSKWSNRTEYPYTNIPNGSYVFEVKARNIYGTESTPATYAFTVLSPWYLTFWAFLLYLVLAFFFVVIIVKLYTRRLKNEKIRLEAIVRERTAEVVRQKEELTDSITYASRIQRAVLPSERLLNEQFPDHFILFKPRDIVSGDFYWMTKQNNMLLITAADCTGHGVPGAFMSLLGISFLNEIVNRSDVLQPNFILNKLRSEVMQSLKQKGEEGETKDGMDMALVSIDKKNRKLYFAGAYNPLFYVRKLTSDEKEKFRKGDGPDFGKGSIHNEEYVLIQVPGDKMPIGISAKDEQTFTLHQIEYSKGDRIYLFSDGYIDQFGGPQGKKFMSRNFKKLLLSIQHNSLKEQGKLLDDNIMKWMNDYPQVDDIIVIGINL